MEPVRSVMRDPRPTNRVPRVFTTRIRAEAGGTWVRRLFPTEGGPRVEPFLLLEQTGPMRLRAGWAGPSNTQPLRAVEAVTYVLHGELEVAHSGGHRVVLQAGDVQWATVGRQVDHTNVPSRRMREQGGLLSVVRVWLRLPAPLSEVEPRFQECPAAAIPEVSWPPGEASVRVVSGDALGTRGPIESASPVNFQVWEMPPGSVATISLPVAQGGFAYVVEGEAGVGSPPVEVREGGLVLLAPGEPVHLHGYVSPGSVARILVFAADARLAG
jgi:redox-sensitive bicupin YhaK (pirin superfamily)